MGSLTDAQVDRIVADIDLRIRRCMRRDQTLGEALRNGALTERALMSFRSFSLTEAQRKRYELLFSQMHTVIKNLENQPIGGSE